MIPKVLRDQLGLLCESEVEFTIKVGALRVLAVAPTSSMSGSLAGTRPAEWCH